jgi:hypothetical protein
MELTAAEDTGSFRRLDPLIPKWLEAEYVDRHDPGRHKAVDTDVHASHVAKCQRKEYWAHKNGKEPQASPYFPLGNDIEDRYGDALREEFGDKRVRQDVGCTIFLPADDAPNGYLRIVGESDWVVFNVDAPGRGHVAYVFDGQDGQRYAKSSYNEEIEGYPSIDTVREWSEYDGSIDRVIETKTIKKLDWLDRFNKRGFRPKHQYQLATYQQAFDAPGELTYITRNELDERRYRVPQEAKVWLEIVQRAYLHYNNRQEDTIPATDPIDPDNCMRFCPFVDECKKVGGSVWDDD